MVQAGGAEKLAGIRHTNFYGHIPLEHGENQLQMPELAAIKARDLENKLLGLLLRNALALQIEDALLTLQRLDGICGGFSSRTLRRPVTITGRFTCI